MSSILADVLQTCAIILPVATMRAVITGAPRASRARRYLTAALILQIATLPVDAVTALLDARHADRVARILPLILSIGLQVGALACTFAAAALALSAIWPPRPPRRRVSPRLPSSRMTTAALR